MAWVIEGNLCNESEQHFNKKTPSTYFKSNLQIQYKSLHLSEIKKENLTLKSCIILAKLVSLVWPVNTLYSSHNWPEIRQSLGINWFSGNEHLISHWYLLTKGKEFNCSLPQMFIGKKSMTLLALEHLCGGKSWVSNSRIRVRVEVTRSLITPLHLQFEPKSQLRSRVARGNTGHQPSKYKTQDRSTPQCYRASRIHIVSAVVGFSKLEVLMQSTLFYISLGNSLSC